jgi:putative endonuclease
VVDQIRSGWYVYIVRCADATLYTGIARDLQARIATHNAGDGAKYTKGRRPVALVYEEMVASRSAALRREYEIKRMTVPAKRMLIATQGDD